MDTGNIITIAVVVVGFVGNAFYLKGSFGAKIENLEIQYKHIVDTVVFKDACAPTVAGMKERLAAVEADVRELS